MSNSHADKIIPINSPVKLINQIVHYITVNRKLPGLKKNPSHSYKLYIEFPILISINKLITIKFNAMSKTYETGHAKNVANFETLLSYIAGYEDAYKPSNASIKLSNLKQKAELARTVSQHVNEVAALHSNEVAARELAFEPCVN